MGSHMVSLKEIDVLHRSSVKLHPLVVVFFQTVGANMSGEMCLRLETDEVQVTTFFKDLQNHHFQARSIRTQYRV